MTNNNRTTKSTSFDRASYYRKRTAEKRPLAIAQLGGCCVRCGSTEQLQFDHRDPATKRKEIANMLVWASEDTLKVELDKCQLLCSDCHHKKTNWERGAPPIREHGTHTMYRHGPCRCVGGF